VVLFYLLIIADKKNELDTCNDTMMLKLDEIQLTSVVMVQIIITFHYEVPSYL